MIEWGLDTLASMESGMYDINHQAGQGLKKYVLAFEDSSKGWIL